MKAIARHIRISPKKANLVAGLVRNKNVTEALTILKLTPKKACPILYKVLHSAIANAENNFKQSRDNLMIKEIVVTQGPTLKRSVPVSRGRVHPILKRTSHITITVGVGEGEPAEEEAPKKDEKKAEAKAEKPAKKEEATKEEPTKESKSK